MTALGAAAAGADMVARCVAGSCKGSRKEVARAPGTLVFYRPGRQVQGEPNSAVLSPTRGTPARYQGRGRPGWARHAWPTCRRLCGRAGSVRTQAAAGQETQQGGAPALPGARHRTALAGIGGGMLLHQGLLGAGGVSSVSGCCMPGCASRALSDCVKGLVEPQPHSTHQAFKDRHSNWQSCFRYC